MTNRFFIGDPHFGHENIISKIVNGRAMRPFSSVQDMDDTIIENWNRIVKDSDKVYVLGDVAMGRRHIKTMAKLKGKKKLIRGNHDLFSFKEYVPYFEDIFAVYILEGIILSHIPLHPTCVYPRFGVNVHGHLHATTLNDPLYFCVSVEQINYTPIEQQDLMQRIKVNQANHELVASWPMAF